MGGECSAYGGEERSIQGFWWGNLRERDHWGEPGIDGRIILKMELQDVRYGVMDWIEMTLDRDRRRALVSTVMNRRVA